MKFFHIADLHIGKRVNAFSMIEDQRHILNQILDAVDSEKPDGLFIAGDVYDKRMPPAEAVALLDDFLTRLSEKNCPVFIISGNHDSAERLGFGNRLLNRAGLHIAGPYNGTVEKHLLSDEHGDIAIFMMPFLKPALVAPYAEEPPLSYDAAVRTALGSLAVDPDMRNILIAHQFVTSGEETPERSDSEMISVGGVDNIDASAFDVFDYVALGHIHRPQKIGRASIRYAGSPLKYSFSEVRHQKSITVVELFEKSNIKLTQIALTPLRDMVEIKGPLAGLIEAGRSLPAQTEDYVRAILTDEEPLYDAVGQLRAVYPNLMALDFENRRTASENSHTAASGNIAEKKPLELFSEFYTLQHETTLPIEYEAWMTRIFDRTSGDDDETH